MRTTYDFPPVVDGAPAPPRLTPGGARDRILDAAYELVLQRGTRDVGIAELISRAGVAKARQRMNWPSRTWSAATGT
ncbi:TetR/AcrR family transcriptional regulator [Arthrobacter globiformis]|uniref:TetR/AcrR family transcriptional regulator n=1 Tax=Arthrobacter globiformis TaxID=1665 RepID=UPI001CB923A2